MLDWKYRKIFNGKLMPFSYFSRNGEIKPVAEAQVPLSNVEYSYGFGVYETIRVTKGRAHFLNDHCQRLMGSARIIDLEHPFESDFIYKTVGELLGKNQAETCNVKILLIGGHDKQSADLYIICLNPFFPDRKLYKTGAHAITYKYERMYPHAKTLNMLPSYLAYREAKRAGAYDALLINNAGNITEGTRTNFFAIKDRVIYSPPADEILLGVTRDHVLNVARDSGFEIVEQDIPLANINQYDGAFITSTSSKIMPIKSIDEITLSGIPESVKELMTAFDNFLNN